MNFNMNATWARAVELIRDNLSLLAVLSGVFLLLPALAIYLLLPDFGIMMTPGVDDAQMEAWLRENAAAVTGLGLFALFMNFTGYGAMIALMGRRRPTVGEAIRQGIRIVPSTIAAMLLTIIVYVIAGIAIVTPITLLATLSGMAGLAIIGVLVAFVLIIWLISRLSLTMPVLVIERTLNPVKALVRSFRLTKPKQWPITLFWVVLFAVYTVISLLVTGLFGVVAALAGTGTAATAIMGLANGAMSMAVGTLICAIAVAMYGQLAGPGAGDLEETFG
ncbi:MAG: hypothetical protein WA985_11070 [Erythrobacter sp.]|uniref:hypothetical protein n=1 Tax=Erythrobacter sp. TaxID=1042 RepID=UPI003C729A6D